MRPWDHGTTQQYLSHVSHEPNSKYSFWNINVIKYNTKNKKEYFINVYITYEKQKWIKWWIKLNFNWRKLIFLVKWLILGILNFYKITHCRISWLWKPRGRSVTTCVLYKHGLLWTWMEFLVDVRTAQPPNSWRHNTSFLMMTSGNELT